MKKRLLPLCTLLLALVPLPMLAQVNDEAEAFRSDMLVYVGGLSRLSPSVAARYGVTPESIERAASSIRTLPAEELLAMKAQMDRVPFWRDVPAMVAYASARPHGVPSPRELARGLGQPTLAPYSPELIRKPLLAFVDAFKRIPAEQVHADYQQRVADLEKLIREATPDQLISIHRDLRENMPRWEQDLNAAMTPTAGRLRAGLDSHCARDFSGVICHINHLFADIGAFFTNLPTYATNAFNSIRNIFSDIFSDFPGTVSGAVSTAVSLLGLNNVNWDAVASTAQQYIKLPCPANTVTLPGFGRVGELRTSTNYNGTIGFAGNTLADVMPGDILTSLDVQALVRVINFPVQWLGYCLEKAADDEFKDAQKIHRDLVTTNLNVTVDSRATQTSVDTAQAWTTNIDSDVVKVEAKLDRLGVVTDRIEDTTERIIATTDRTEAVANRLETTSVRLDTTSSRLESKVDNLQLQQGQTGDALGLLRANFLRMTIEQDLFGQAGFRIALFQLPANVGGFIELARSIVDETLTRRGAAGVNVASALRDLQSGDAQYAAGNFKAAYGFFRSAYQKAAN